MSDFSDRPLVAGSLTGLRAFKADRLGRLTGVTHAEVFRPDENNAVCRKASARLTGIPEGARAEMTYTSTLTWQPMETAAITVTLDDGSQEVFRSVEELERRYPPKTDSEHQVAERDCACGFYAYFDGKNDYNGSTDAAVQALIEGYGVCTVGSRGFRASKARLVAFVDPHGSEPEEAPDDEPRRHWWTPFGRVWNAFWLTVSIIGLALGIVADNLVTIGLNAASIGMWSAIIWGPKARKAWKEWRSGGHNYSTHVTFSYAGARSPQPISEVRWARVRANYPDVPVYPSLKAALAEHPLTVPPKEPLPTPQTHAEFWDMQVPS